MEQQQAKFLAESLKASLGLGHLVHAQRRNSDDWVVVIDCGNQEVIRFGTIESVGLLGTRAIIEFLSPAKDKRVGVILCDPFQEARP